ncbi:hypothetical protein Aspvir_001727 [Aspergillus viridinutans]|uniref:chitinase n=1 Tax=Aspergillus viridinutans TaxID=75553 RepID=A0A9P3EZS8_ASPVI|nr:uncharacterized protein Aspvir_001727 [Aspergillus viridinutans]GIJ99593.1 hypothetical protein Aspvir_001727 [Aspergillus viridinutans]
MLQPTVMNFIIVTVAWSIAGTLALKASITKAMDAYIAAHPIPTLSVGSTQSVKATSNRTSVLQGDWASGLSNTTRSRCPDSCSILGLDPTGWPVYHSVDRLGWCNQTMLLNFALFNSLDDPKTHASIAACVADLSDDSEVTTNSTAVGNASCLPEKNANKTTNVTGSLQLSSSASIQSGNASAVIAALNELHALSLLCEDGCNETIQFALSGQAVVGVYSGSGFAGQSVLSSVLEQLVDRVQSNGIGSELVVQLCDLHQRASRYSLGVIAHMGSDFASVQQAVQAWKNNSCVTTTADQTVESWKNVTFLAPVMPRNSTNGTSMATQSPCLSQLNTRDTCTTVQVVYGDTCTSLASECGITGTEFEDYNTADDLCSSLTVGEYLCCSEGTLPDYSPQPDDDDNCYVYLVQTGDTCDSIAAAYDTTTAKIESYNNDTWGWMGCSDLLVGNNICLSSGWPPMPTVITNAVCGPQVNGTPTAPHGTNLSTLNECPLNACCDIWGQCGTTAEFCTISQSSTGAPGTAAPGQNGCISNCGTDIVLTGYPSDIYSIAYFEGFDWSRPCLTMSVSEIDTSSYTHIHFAFATISTDYTLNISSIEAQLPFFTALSGVKRVLSVGGWDFSTSPDTYMIFRDAVTSTNRATLIQSVVDVLEKYDLDGIDWDWEYPDEPDIPGIPAGTAADSTNYFVTLGLLMAALDGTGRTISVTAPASFWYLQNFPIQAISDVVDYIVYMTYDLHGQWDYGNAYADPGCSGGNCLRSHVNLTETINSLSMITKAGVSNTQIVVGVASYGRSFKMTTSGCWTEMCTYTGPDSGALPGICTETAGYIADAELETIIAENPTAEVHWDTDSFSNILVYNDTEWVSYMNDSNKAIRILLYELYGFLGTADWAVDVQSEGGSSSSSSSDDNTTSMAYIGPTVWSEATLVVTGMPGETLVWPPLQLSGTTTISFPLWTTVLSFSTLSTSTYTDSDGSTSTDLVYDTLTIPTVITVPPVTTTAIPVWNIILPTDATDGDIELTSSVQPLTFTIIITPVWDGTTSIAEPTSTTQNSTIVAWHSTTYVIPPVTETVGSSTTITGGTTGTPVPIIITPHPYPTDVTSTPDPDLNTKSTSWTSGTPASPSCGTGEICGIPCLLWCYSGCPLCPPGLFGSTSSGGSSSGDDSSDDSSSSSSSSSSTATTSTATYTAAGFHLGEADIFPTSVDDYSSFAASSSAYQSAYDSQFSSTTTKSTTTKATTTTTESTKSTTSTASTSTATSTSTTRKWVSFYLMEEYTGISWIFERMVIDSIGGVEYDPCEVSPDAEVTADTVAPNPDFPDSDIGPFEAHGVPGCQYTAGKDNTVGTLTCPGVDGIACAKDSDYGELFECDGPVMVYVMACFRDS